MNLIFHISEDGSEIKLLQDVDTPHPDFKEGVGILQRKILQCHLRSENMFDVIEP